jgi:hypothetical protein
MSRGGGAPKSFLYSRLKAEKSEKYFQHTICRNRAEHSLDEFFAVDF